MNQALIDAITKFQSDSGFARGATPEQFLAGMPNVTGLVLNNLSSDLRIQAINIFGLAGLKLPGGATSPAGDLGPYTPTALMWTTKDGVNFLRDYGTNYNAEGTAMTYLQSCQDGSGTQLLRDPMGSDWLNILQGRWRTPSDPTGVITPGGTLTTADRGYWWDSNNNPTAANWQLYTGNGPPNFPHDAAAPPPVLTPADRAYWWWPDGTPTEANWTQYAGSGPPQFP
jgi:hypothetical protein